MEWTLSTLATSVRDFELRLEGYDDLSIQILQSCSELLGPTLEAKFYMTAAFHRTTKILVP